MKVEFGGSTGRVAFDQFGRRRNYQLDVLEQRGDQEPAKVALLIIIPYMCLHYILFWNYRNTSCISCRGHSSMEHSTGLRQSSSRQRILSLSFSVALKTYLFCFLVPSDTDNTRHADFVTCSWSAVRLHCSAVRRELRNFPWKTINVWRKISRYIKTVSYTHLTLPTKRIV